MNFAIYIIPIFVAFVLIFAVFKKVDVFKEFTKGAKENLGIGLDILPSLVFLLLAIEMFKASGALQALVSLLSPIASVFGIPADCLPLALMRPVSGSGALSILSTTLQSNHPDSFVGRVASVLMGSTETTFYTIAVYFGATKVKKTRHALVSSLAGDFTALIMSSLTVSLLLH